jgi:hypothetical protein
MAPKRKHPTSAGNMDIAVMFKKKGIILFYITLKLEIEDLHERLHVRSW